MYVLTLHAHQRHLVQSWHLLQYNLFAARRLCRANRRPVSPSDVFLQCCTRCRQRLRLGRYDQSVELTPGVGVWPEVVEDTSHTWRWLLPFPFLGGEGVDDPIVVYNIRISKITTTTTTAFSERKKNTNTNECEHDFVSREIHSCIIFWFVREYVWVCLSLTTQSHPQTTVLRVAARHRTETSSPAPGCPAWRRRGQRLRAYGRASGSGRGSSA